MKKFFYYAAALAALVSASACQREALVDDTQAEEVEVTFTISTEDALSTKAIGDADSYSKELQFYAYRNGEYLDQLEADIQHFGTGLTAKVTAKLVKGQDYDFVFWAQAEGSSYYTIDPQTKTMTVDYSGLNCNDETRDAFWTVVEDLHISAAMPAQKIVLRRPFAQINVGTSADDYAAALQSKVEINKTSVTLSNAAATMDIFTGKTSDETSVTFNTAAVPAEKLIVYEGTKNLEYVYLALNYILVADNSSTGYDKDVLTDFKVTFFDDDVAVNTVEVSSVPVRRNFRTNIIGNKILTDYATFEIIIDPMFDGEYDYSYSDGTVTVLPYTLYLKPNSNWTVDNARFAVYYWDGLGKDGWADLVDSDGDGIYEVLTSALGDATNIIFCRMNPGDAANNWNNKWNQTGDLIVPTDGTNLYTVASGTWDSGGGTWSVK